MKKGKGFLLAEAVFSLLITMLVFLTLKNLLFSLAAANKSQVRQDEVAYAYVQFDRFLRDEDVNRVYAEPEASSPKRAVFVRETLRNGKKDKKRYFLEQYNSMLRLTTESTGHMPLLLKVKQTHFQTRAGQIRIDVTENDGRYSQLVFKLGSKENEEDKS